MLPVSGAAQLSAAGAIDGLRPVISASGAYWRLVRPAPCSPGRNRFHSPASRAWACSRAITGGIAHPSETAPSERAGGRVRRKVGLGGVDVVVHEGEEPLAVLLRQFVEGEFHQRSSSASCPRRTSGPTRAPMVSKPSPTVWP